MDFIRNDLLIAMLGLQYEKLVITRAAPGSANGLLVSGLHVESSRPELALALWAIMA